MIPQQPIQPGVFVPTNFVWDIQKINSSKLDPLAKELFVRLYQNITFMSIAINKKDTGVYNLAETSNVQQWFANPIYNSSTPITPSDRGSFRKVIYWTTPLPNNSSVAIPHYINCTAATLFVDYYATATDNVNFRYAKLPYASPTLANNIEINVDGTYVNIITGSDRTNFTQTVIVLEYLQS